MRDLLTEEDVSAIWCDNDTADEMIQAAASLGAERERERAARVCEAVSRARHARGLPSGYNAIMECAEAIRRGEEG